MSRSNSNRQRNDSGFFQKLAWTVLFGLVFGAGLITGQRLIGNESSTPLVSVGHDDSETTSTETSESAKTKGEPSKEEPVFSFYDRLSDDNPKQVDSNGVGDGSQPAGATGDDSKVSDEDESEAARYTLQVSAHSSMEKARSKMRRLQKIGLDPYLISAKIPDKGKYFRVRIGKFPSMKAARRFKKEIKKKRGVETFVSPL